MAKSTTIAVLTIGALGYVLPDIAIAKNSKIE